MPKNSYPTLYRESRALATGTAVGGGSLALPYFTAAGGFLPAVALLAVSYAALLTSAMLLMVGEGTHCAPRPSSFMSCQCGRLATARKQQIIKKIASPIASTSRSAFRLALEGLETRCGGAHFRVFHAHRRTGGRARKGMCLGWSVGVLAPPLRCPLRC